MADEPDYPEPVNYELVVSRLAREIARDLIPVEEICTRYKLTEDAYQRILRHPMFARRFQEELDIWNASTPRAISERIGAKAATMIEESLVEIYSLIHDKNVPMASKVEALKWASRMAGIGEKDVTQQTLGERVKFNIYIGDTKVSFDKEITDAKTIEGSAVLVDKAPL
jgi:hypothetical protein